MDDQAVRAMAEEEKTYWWYISRREILQSVLARHAEFMCPANAGISASPSRHSGKSRICGTHPESYPLSSSGLARGSRQKNKQKNSFCSCLDSRWSLPSSPIGGGNDRENGNDREGKNDSRLNILDVGCGTGENFHWLEKFGEVIGVDTSELAIELSSQKGTAVLGRAEDLPFEGKEFDLITAFDILEHLSDEERALREWGRVLQPGGLLFLSVPAYQWLFGPHDRALGHYRRYNQPGLVKLLKDNGFQPIFSSYIFCLTFPLFLLQRTLVKLAHSAAQPYISVPKLINALLVGIGRWEANWLRFGQFPWGNSLVVLAKKND